MSRLRRAWAVLRGREDTSHAHLQACFEKALERNNEAFDRIAAMHSSLLPLRESYDKAMAHNASLRASLDDAHRQHAITSAKAAGLERVLRTILEAADHGLANPTENGR